MLISCPKCHSIYDIPDGLIEKTGQNFRCQACSNVWHAMPSDALGYEAKKEEEKPFIEEIEVKEPPYRNYPSNVEDYEIVQDGKSGRKTISSKELLESEGNPQYQMPKVKKKKEIVLTSDYGTSFTISTDNNKDDVKDSRFFSDNDDEGLKVDVKERISDLKPRRRFVKLRMLLWLLLILVVLFSFRGLIVAVYQPLEGYYNKIGLSGFYNVHNLKFQNVSITKEVLDGKDVIKVVANIYNDGFLATKVPDVEIVGKNKKFTPNRTFLKAKEKTDVIVLIDELKGADLLSFKLEFVK